MEDTGIIESIEENMKNITTAASEGRLQQLLEEMMPGIVGFLLNIVFAFILLFVGRKLIQFILKLLNRSFDKAKTDASLRGFLNSLLRVIMYSVLIYDSRRSGGDSHNLFSRSSWFGRSCHRHGFAGQPS